MLFIEESLPNRYSAL